MRLPRRGCTGQWRSFFRGRMIGERPPPEERKVHVNRTYVAQLEPAHFGGNHATPFAALGDIFFVSEPVIRVCHSRPMRLRSQPFAVGWQGLSAFIIRRPTQ